VIRDRLDHLFWHCADLGLDVEWAHLQEGRRGVYFHDLQLILLSRRLTRAQAVSTLAHELGHHRFGDTCSNPANERRAWQYAAAMLISPQEYRAAEDLVGPSAPGLAVELEVTPQLIHAWRDWWHQRGRLLQSDEGSSAGEDLGGGCGRLDV
jgi:Zn-dependent peptidase ImmA (M78 family)